jgi:hypothetical protein
MRKFTGATAAVFLALAFFGATPNSAAAQTAEFPARTQVISANPFGLLLELFNAEYERVVGTSSTAGVGGSSYFGTNDAYVNADIFWRFYPQGTPFHGWAFGVKAGITNVGDEGTYFGAGFDVNRSWLLGQQENFYVGVGFGLKRMYISSDESFDLKYIPTFRIINVGVAF